MLSRIQNRNTCYSDSLFSHNTRVENNTFGSIDGATALKLDESYEINEEHNSEINFVLFPPVKGTISHEFNAREKHYAIDIVTSKDAPVKSAADGTVIFSEWTTQTGYVIIIEHSNNLISRWNIVIICTIGIININSKYLSKKCLQIL